MTGSLGNENLLNMANVVFKEVSAKFSKEFPAKTIGFEFLEDDIQKIGVYSINSEEITREEMDWLFPLIIEGLRTTRDRDEMTNWLIPNIIEKKNTPFQPRATTVRTVEVSVLPTRKEV